MSFLPVDGPPLLQVLLVCGLAGMDTLSRSTGSMSCAPRFFRQVHPFQVKLCFHDARINSFNRQFHAYLVSVCPIFCFGAEKGHILLIWMLVCTRSDVPGLPDTAPSGFLSSGSSIV